MIKFANYKRAYGFICTLIELQPNILHVREAWLAIDQSRFDSAQQRAQFELLAVSGGVFRDFVLAHAGRLNANNAVLSSYVTLARQKNVRSIIQDWQRRIEFKRPSLKPPIELFELDLMEHARREPTAPEQGGYETFQRVTTIQEAIVRRLDRGDLVNAVKFANELVDMQLAKGGNEFASKSLCLLAQEAKRRGYTSLQLEWVLKAVEIAPDDEWARGQAGDAFLDLYRFSDAVAQYEKAGTNSFAAMGLARVLRESGRYEQAFLAFNEAAQRFPDDHRAWAGMGESLRGMGRPEEALKVYSEAIGLFSNEAVLWCGKAASLKDMGELDASLAAYREATHNFPSSLHAWAGLGGVLKTLGEFDGAIESYDEAIRQFPDDPIGYCGRAEVLREKGQLKDALSLFQWALTRFADTPSVYSGYAETLRDMGQLSEALDVYDEAVKRFELETYLRNGRANILKLQGRLEEALSAYDRNVQDLPYDLMSLVTRADLLKELGQYDDALSALEDIARKHPRFPAVRNSKAAVLTILGRFSEALQLLPETPPRTRDEWFAYHVRGMINLRSKNFAEATRIFTTGLERIRYHKERAFFHNALAATKIAQGAYRDGGELAQKGRGPVAKILQLHSFAALGEKPRAMECLTALLSDPHPNVIHLSEEIARRFKLLPGTPKYSEAWITTAEQEAVLAIAA